MTSRTYLSYIEGSGLLASSLTRAHTQYSSNINVRNSTRMYGTENGTEMFLVSLAKGIKSLSATQGT